MRQPMLWPTTRGWVVIVVVVVGLMVLLLAIRPVTRPPAAKVSTPSYPSIAKTDTNGYLQVNPDHPFRDTPAILWLEGADGIEVPPAAAVGRFPVETVAAAEDRAKQLIVLARLDQHVLDTGDAEPVLALVAQGQVDEIRPKLTPGNESETWWVTTKVAPGFKLLPAKPRVDGSMSAALDDKGELVIKTNYIVAYAFQAPHPSAIRDPMEIIVLAREEVDYTWIDDSTYDAPSQGMWIDNVHAFTYAGNCDWFRKGYLAPSYSETPTYGTPVRPTEQYFDPNIPLPTEHDC